MMWIWIILAVVYLLSPIDLIPGLHAMGWLDDIVVLVLLYRYLSRFRRMTPGNNGPFNSGGDSNAQSGNSPPQRPRSPHEVLGIPETATKEEIKSAYRTLAGQYHPDKVAHLGDELQALAEQRFKEIQDAYHKLMN